MNPKDIKLLLEGVEIQQADNYADAINITDGKPKYLVVIRAKDVKMLVSIPKFSEYQVTITTAATGKTRALQQYSVYS